MTTIAYRDGVMAADSRAYGGDKVPIGEKVKIKRLADGTLIGASTTMVGGAGWALAWYEAGCPVKAGDSALLPEKFDLLVVKPNGEGYVACNEAALTGPLQAPYFAIGSGDEFALGAMAHGANAIQAAIIGARLDPWSGLPIYAASHCGRCPALEVGLPPEQFKWIQPEE
jgi:ATP-dependent protease HslVU (ClpYQ) peptidase subunit